MSKPSSSEEFQPNALTKKVLNLDVTFHWIAGSDRFWFKRETRAGDEFVVVDAQTGEQSLISDTIALGAERARADWVVSPAGQSAVLRRQNDLWLRDLSGGKE